MQEQNIRLGLLRIASTTQQFYLAWLTPTVVNQPARPNLDPSPIRCVDFIKKKCWTDWISIRLIRLLRVHQHLLFFCPSAIPNMIRYFLTPPAALIMLQISCRGCFGGNHLEQISVMKSVLLTDNIPLLPNPTIVQPWFLKVSVGCSGKLQHGTYAVEGNQRSPHRSRWLSLLNIGSVRSQHCPQRTARYLKWSPASLGWNLGTALDWFLCLTQIECSLSLYPAYFSCGVPQWSLFSHFLYVSTLQNIQNPNNSFGLGFVLLDSWEAAVLPYPIQWPDWTPY